MLESVLIASPHSIVHLFEVCHHSKDCQDATRPVVSNNNTHELTLWQACKNSQSSWYIHVHQHYHVNLREALLQSCLHLRLTDTLPPCKLQKLAVINKRQELWSC